MYGRRVARTFNEAQLAQAFNFLRLHHTLEQRHVTNKLTDILHFLDAKLAQLFVLSLSTRMACIQVESTPRRYG